LEGLDQFNVKLNIDVRWGDMDAFPIYIKWVECARVEYLVNHVHGPFKKKSLGPILARQDIRYIFPITFPDTVIVGYKTNEILEDRIICECRIYSEKYKKLSAIAYNTIMPYDFKKLAKTSFPKTWIHKIEAIDFK